MRMIESEGDYRETINKKKNHENSLAKRDGNAIDRTESCQHPAWRSIERRDKLRINLILDLYFSRKELKKKKKNPFFRTHEF